MLPATFEEALTTVNPGSSKFEWRTMVAHSKLRSLWDAIHLNLTDVPGDIVECGVWRGGASMMMLFAESHSRQQLHAAGRKKGTHPPRDAWLFDTFEGMPDSGERDGTRAQKVVKKAEHKNWTAEALATGGDGGMYVDANGVKRWNYGPIDVVRSNIASTVRSLPRDRPCGDVLVGGAVLRAARAAARLACVGQCAFLLSHRAVVCDGPDAHQGYPMHRVHFVKGKVEETLPTVPDNPKEIALLRLDTDWYASTAAEFELLAPRLAVGGMLVVDDFCTWRGAPNPRPAHTHTRVAKLTDWTLHDRPTFSSLTAP